MFITTKPEVAEYVILTKHLIVFSVYQRGKTVGKERSLQHKQPESIPHQITTVLVSLSNYFQCWCVSNCW